MSRLREQLEQARDAYRAQRYPADLAAMVLSVRRRRWRVVATIAGTAAAAVVALVIWRGSIQTPTGSVELGRTEQMTPVPMFVELADDTSLVLPYQAIALPAMPAFPSLDELQQGDSTSTTQESV